VLKASPSPWTAAQTVFLSAQWALARSDHRLRLGEELFARLGGDWLIVKNAGGEAPLSKLIAARNLGIHVVMIRRPPQPDAPRVETVGEALAWIDTL